MSERELRKYMTWALEWLCEDIDALAERDAGLDLALDTVRDDAKYALSCWRELNRRKYKNERKRRPQKNTGKE